VYSLNNKKTAKKMAIQFTNGFTLTKNPPPPPTAYYMFGSPRTLYDFTATGSYSNGTSVVADLSGNSNNGTYINGSGEGTATNIATYTTTSPAYIHLEQQKSIKTNGDGALLANKQSYTYLMWFKHYNFNGGGYPGIDGPGFEMIINNDISGWRIWHNRNGNYAMINFNGVTPGVPAFSTTKWYLWSVRYNGSTNTASVDIFMDGNRYTVDVASSSSINYTASPFRVGLRFNNWLNSDVNYYASYGSDIGTSGLQTIYDNTKSRFGY
jgi:hypothetical protein